MNTSFGAGNHPRSVVIDGHRHQFRHLHARVAEVLAEARERGDQVTMPGAVWAVHCDALARSEWGPRGYVRSARLDSASRDGSVKVFELTLCRDGRHGTEYVHRWTTKRSEELADAVAMLGLDEGVQR